MKYIFPLFFLIVLFSFDCKAQQAEADDRKEMMHPDTIRIYKTATDFTNHKFTEVDIKTFNNLRKGKENGTMGKLTDQWGFQEIYGSLTETYRMSDDKPYLFVICGSLCLYAQGFFYAGALHFTGGGGKMYCSNGLNGDLILFNELPDHIKLDNNCRQLFDNAPKSPLASIEKYVTARVEVVRLYNKNKTCNECGIDMFKQY